jgi:hypothetical protein
MHGRDVILISDYAKSIKRKSVNNNFVLQFNLDRAFSTNEKLLATVTQGNSSSLANPRPYVSGLSRASYGRKDQSSIGYDQGSSSSESRYIDLVDLPAMEEYDEKFGAEKQDLPTTVHYEKPTVHYESSPDEFVRQGRRSNHSHKRYNAKDDFHASKPPGERRYTMHAGNIPGASLLPDKLPKHARLILSGNQTANLRLILLTTIAEGKIPEERHRNYGTASKETLLDTSCFLVWYENFVKRCLGKNIYCPCLRAFMPNSCMGIEWETGGVPDELIEKYALLSNALKEDLMYSASKQESILNIISLARCGFSALHNVIRLACPLIKERVPNSNLLNYPDGKDISVHVKRVHEYILQSTYVGINIAPFQQWQLIIKMLPHALRAMLETSASNAISLARYDRDSNDPDIPFNLKIENAASFILSEAMNKGMTKHLVPPARSKVIETAQILKFFANKPKRCFYCQEEHLASDCPKYHLVDKKTGAKKLFVKREFPAKDFTKKPPRKTIAEIGVDDASPDTDLDVLSNIDESQDNDDDLNKILSMIQMGEDDHGDEFDEFQDQTISSLFQQNEMNEENNPIGLDFNALNFDYHA